MFSSKLATIAISRWKQASTYFGKNIGASANVFPNTVSQCVFTFVVGSCIGIVSIQAFSDFSDAYIEREHERIEHRMRVAKARQSIISLAYKAASALTEQEKENLEEILKNVVNKDD